MTCIINIISSNSHLEIMLRGIKELSPIPNFAFEVGPKGLPRFLNRLKLSDMVSFRVLFILLWLASFSLFFWEIFTFPDDMSSIMILSGEKFVSFFNVKLELFLSPFPLIIICGILAGESDVT